MNSKKSNLENYTEMLAVHSCISVIIILKLSKIHLCTYFILFHKMMQLRIYTSKYQYSCPCWQENIYGNPKKIFKSGSIHHSGHISRAGSQRDRTSVDILEFSPCEESYHEYFWIAATSGPALATLGSADLWAMFEEIPTLHKDFFKNLC